MIGALIGDIVGSRYEFKEHKGKDFALFTNDCHCTDDSYMTLAIAKAFLYTQDFKDLDLLKKNEIKFMKQIASEHKDAGWGANFYDFLFYDTKPYNSCGNGAGMRVSPVGWVAQTEEEVRILSKAVTEISHNHPEGIKGAEAIAMSIFLARKGETIEEIKQRMIKDYYPELATMTLDELQKNYGLDDFGRWVTCQGSIPQTLTCFFASTSFVDAIRNAISIAGDADTIGCMCGSIAEAYYGVDDKMVLKALEYVPENLKSIYYAFRNKYMTNSQKEIKKLNKKDINNKMIELANILEYNYKDITWLAKAMRAQKIEDKEDHTNDALATVGDALLKFVLADDLFKKGKDKEGITNDKSEIEKNETLYKMLMDKRYNIIDYAYHDRAFYLEANEFDQVSNSKDHTTYIEAIIGAIYYDKNFNYVSNWILTWLKPKLEKFI